MLTHVGWLDLNRKSELIRDLTAFKYISTIMAIKILVVFQIYKVWNENTGKILT